MKENRGTDLKLMERYTSLKARVLKVALYFMDNPHDLEKYAYSIGKHTSIPSNKNQQEKFKEVLSGQYRGNGLFMDYVFSSLVGHDENNQAIEFIIKTKDLDKVEKEIFS